MSEWDREDEIDGVAEKIESLLKENSGVAYTSLQIAQDIDEERAMNGMEVNKQSVGTLAEMLVYRNKVIRIKGHNEVLYAAK